METRTNGWNCIDGQRFNLFCIDWETEIRARLYRQHEHNSQNYLLGFENGILLISNFVEQDFLTRLVKYF